MLGYVNAWGLDVLKVASLVTEERALTCVTYRIFQERDLLRHFKIPARTMVNFLMTLEDHYVKDIPYHNHRWATFSLNFLPLDGDELKHLLNS